MSNSSEGRRLSISDASDVLSDPGSPAKDGSVTAPATIPEEVRSCELSGNPRERCFCVADKADMTTRNPRSPSCPITKRRNRPLLHVRYGPL